MNFVQPIRDPEVIRAIKRYLKEKNERDYMMFILGINSGLRISDILPLRVSDAKRPYFSMREKKTGKQKRLDMTPVLKKELKIYVEDKKDHEFLFKSREGINKPIGRSMAYKILRDAAEHVRITEIGTHTLRKTFGYHFYQQTKDVAILQKIFNHTSPSLTLRYIGIEQDGIDKAIKEFKI
ncbi:site-specific integrase [Bacillus sp. es.036]|uniref:site-specific integrase n=1 Tax=Bacillus sp. es.036 TaxID=1761764 RepID=UPI000BF8D98C|nr:site-specific integrase [Bacillus sp. es.036]PFG13054.1 phage integrase family protein [Bacillus sp. es.036]